MARNCVHPIDDQSAVTLWNPLVNDVDDDHHVMWRLGAQFITAHLYQIQRTCVEAFENLRNDVEQHNNVITSRLGGAVPTDMDSNSLASPIAEDLTHLTSPVNKKRKVSSPTKM